MIFSKNDIEITDDSKQVINRIVNLYNSSFKVTINKKCISNEAIFFKKE